MQNSFLKYFCVHLSVRYEDFFHHRLQVFLSTTLSYSIWIKTCVIVSLKLNVYLCACVRVCVCTSLCLRETLYVHTKASPTLVRSLLLAAAWHRSY